MTIDVLRIDGLKVAKARLALPHENGRHVSQAKLAERTGLHVVTLSNIERGKTTDTTLSTLSRLAQALGVGITDLVGDDGEQLGPDDDTDEDSDLPLLSADEMLRALAPLALALRQAERFVMNERGELVIDLNFDDEGVAA